MSDQSRNPRDLLPLSPPAFHVLLALGEERLHGYAIMREFESRTAGRELLLPGTLYTTIARMLELGLIQEVGNRPPAAEDDRRRRYYQVTEFGREVARAEASRMRLLLDVAAQQRLTTDPVS